MNSFRIVARLSWCAVVAAGPALATGVFRESTAAPPNVLFIIADDASCHFGCYGCSWVKTPHIDALAARGIVFAAAYAPTAKCAPCRAGLLTGRYPWQLEEAANHWCTFPPHFAAFTEALAAHGVRCGRQGKVWGPGVALGADGRPRTWGLDNTPFRKFLATSPADKPFFFWYGSHNPHRPYDRDAGATAGKKPADIDRVPAFWPDDEIVRRDMLDYATEIEAFDSEVGDLVAALRESGRLENTLVVVTSDHGMPFPRMKGHTYELAHRVPLVASWPAGIVHPGRRCNRLVSLVDVAPTMLEASGVPQDTAGLAPITGTSLVDVLCDEALHERPFVLVGRERNDVQCRPGTPSGLGYPARGIRQGRWLYVHNFAPDRWPCGDPDVALADTDDSPTKRLLERAGPDDRFWQLAFGKRPADELYDVDADPDCIANLAALPAHAADLERLRGTLMAELRRLEDPRVVGDGDVFDRYVAPANPRPRQRAW